MLVCLVSLTFFFGGLVLAFGLRIEQQHAWERFVTPRALWLGTAFLLFSSGTLESGRYALRRALIRIYRVRMAITVVLALLFLLVQVVSAADLLRQGVAAAVNPHGSVFYVFMGLHGAHLLGGVGWLIYLYWRSRALFEGTESDLRRYRRLLAPAALYWHFMGVLWVVLFYFLRRWTAS